IPVDVAGGERLGGPGAGGGDARVAVGDLLRGHSVGDEADDVVDGDAGAADARGAALPVGVDPHGAVAVVAELAGATAGGPPRGPVPVALLGGLRQRGPGVVHDRVHQVGGGLPVRGVPLDADGGDRVADLLLDVNVGCHVVPVQGPTAGVRDALVLVGLVPPGAGAPPRGPPRQPVPVQLGQQLL